MAAITISIMDITGRVVGEQVLHNTGQTAFDVRQYTPGLYMYRAVAGNARYVGKVLINR